MRTINVASISLLTLMAAGTVTPAAAQGASAQAPARGAYRIGSISETTASTASPTRPATMPNGILKTQPPRWSTEAVKGAKQVRINPNPTQVREIPNTARQTLANPQSRARFDAGRQTRTGRLVNPRPAGSGSAPMRLGSISRAHGPVTSTRPVTSAASAPRHVRIVRTPPPSQPVRMAAGTSAQAAGKGALVSGAKVAAKGAAGGVLIYGSIEVISQEIDSPGKTITDLRNGNIKPKWNEIGASAAAGAGAAALGAAGVGAAPVLAAGAGIYAGVLITEQEIKDPGKTARDIKAMTGGAIDLKKAGDDVNKAAASAGRQAAKTTQGAVKGLNKATAKAAKDVEKGLLNLFGKK